jgi:hypothetical protein
LAVRGEGHRLGPLEWPSRVCRFLPVLVFQSLMMLSCEPEARVMQAVYICKLFQSSFSSSFALTANQFPSINPAPNLIRDLDVSFPPLLSSKYCSHRIELLSWIEKRKPSPCSRQHPHSLVRVKGSRRSHDSRPFSHL